MLWLRVVVDNSAGTQALDDSEAALTAEHLWSSEARASNATLVMRLAEVTVRLHHQTHGWSVRFQAALVNRSGCCRLKEEMSVDVFVFKTEGHSSGSHDSQD